MRHRSGTPSAPAAGFALLHQRTPEDMDRNGQSAVPPGLTAEKVLDAIVVPDGGLTQVLLQEAWPFVAFLLFGISETRRAPAKHALGSPMLGVSHVTLFACLTPCRSDSSVLPFSVVLGLISSSSCQPRSPGAACASPPPLRLRCLEECERDPPHGSCSVGLIMMFLLYACSGYGVRWLWLV